MSFSFQPTDKTLLLKGGKFFMGHGFRSPSTELEELMRRVHRAVRGQQGHESFTQGLKTRQEEVKDLIWHQSPIRGAFADSTVREIR